MFQVAEHAIRFQDLKDFPVQREFSWIAQVMNGKAGNDNVERAERREWIVQIVFHNRNFSVMYEPCTGSGQHDG